MVNGWYIKNPPWKQLNRRLNTLDQLLDGWEKFESRCREIIAWRCNWCLSDGSLSAPMLKTERRIPCTGA